MSHLDTFVLFNITIYTSPACLRGERAKCYYTPAIFCTDNYFLEAEVCETQKPYLIPPRGTDII
jgi:hypothetical protein